MWCDARSMTPCPQIPEVNESVLDIPHDVAGKPGVGVAPVRRVEASDVVTAEECHQVIDDEHLAMVTAGIAREPEAGRDQRMPAHSDVLWEDEEGARNDGNFGLISAAERNMVRIPGEVARESAVISPAIPI